MDPGGGDDEEMADWEESAGDLLAQFQVQSHGVNGPPVLPVVPLAPVKDSLELKLDAVEVPPLVNAHEFDFLPGHFDAHCIISEKSDRGQVVSYEVKLRSGEVKSVSPSRLTTLSRGQEALNEFHSDQDDLLDLEELDGHRIRKRDIPSYNILSHPSSTATDDSPMASDEEDFGSSEPDTLKARRSRRATRPRNTYTAFFNNVDSDDEKGASSSEDIIARATSGPRRLRLRTRRRQSSRATRQPLRLSDTDSDYGPKGTRASTRQKKSLRLNLRERFEDDISENEEASTEKKFFGARETFQTLSPDNPFKRRHLNRCDVCDDYGNSATKGPLVFCQGCTIAYHQVCLGSRATREHLATKVSDTQFILQCRRCLGISNVKDSICPHQGCCMDCKHLGPMSAPLRGRLTPKQEQQLRHDNNGEDPITPVDMARVNNVDNLLFRCISCHRAFHFEHLPPLSDALMDDDDVVSSRVREYCVRWQCHDCISVPGEIGTMVSWRPSGFQNFVSDYTADVMEEVDKEYLIRWKGMSYYHTAWMAGSWVWGVVSPAMRRAFFRSPKNLHPHMTTEEAIPEDFLRVDIIFDVRYSKDSNPNDHSLEGNISRVDDIDEAYVKFKGLPYEDAVWESPPARSDTERWADFKSAYKDWVMRDYVHIPDQKALEKHLSSVRKKNFKSSVVLHSQPETMTGGEIMDYQKDGLNWLYYMWFKQQNAILADEMGLGKTIQVIGLFATLVEKHDCWPFLVVVPNSICPNWRKEIKQWVPSIRVVTYYGSSFARKLGHDYEMFPGKNRDLRCHVVVTSYETMIDDSSRRALSRIPWAGLIVDEGQRLKNDKSQLYEALSGIRFPFKVLLTGTPLQNNTRELFNLLHFCDPSKDAEALDAEYGVLSKENIPELHNMIRPFFLRRTKAQVLTFLPPIAQIIVPVSMSVVQKKLYKSILAKNPQLIKTIFQRADSKGPKQTERHSLNNILMQLRKCLCHPFVYSKAIEEQTSNTIAYHRQLVEAAGKFQLLQLMLPKLRQRGHRVLIFSQFLENLDLVEDFLDGLGLLYRRLDGRMSSLEKQKQIDEFNTDDSPYFAFLLSTRSGGIGINLASADTVIIMDPDFNPHQDMQALSRAHRIGQKNKVLVFQLMIRGSAEEKIMQIGKKKMVLDHVLIDRMVSEEEDGRDLESILRHGAQALFEDDDSGDIHYDSESVDRLLDRSQEQQALTPDEDAGESQFSFARVWAHDNQNMEGQLQESEDDIPNPTVWEKILREREVAAAEEARRKAEAFGRGKRKRTAVDYASNIEDISPQKPSRISREDQSDAEFREDEAIAAESSSADSDTGEREAPLELAPVPKKKKVRPFKRVDPEALSGSVDGAMERDVDCYACKTIHPLGYCRLKLAGVEHCGLCGIAHFGYSRTCPHLQSEDQVARILDALKESSEDRALIAEAKRYVRGIRGSLAQQARLRAKAAALKSAAMQASNAVPDTSTTAPPAFSAEVSHPLSTQSSHIPYQSPYHHLPEPSSLRSPSQGHPAPPQQSRAPVSSQTLPRPRPMGRQSSQGPPLQQSQSPVSSEPSNAAQSMHRPPSAQPQHPAPQPSSRPPSQGPTLPKWRPNVSTQPSNAAQSMHRPPSAQSQHPSQSLNRPSSQGPRPEKWRPGVSPQPSNAARAMHRPSPAQPQHPASQSLDRPSSQAPQPSPPSASSQPSHWVPAQSQHPVSQHQRPSVSTQQSPSSTASHPQPSVPAKPSYTSSSGPTARSPSFTQYSHPSLVTHSRNTISSSQPPQSSSVQASQPSYPTQPQYPLSPGSTTHQASFSHSSHASFSAPSRNLPASSQSSQPSASARSSLPSYSAQTPYQSSPGPIARQPSFSQTTLPSFSTQSQHAPASQATHQSFSQSPRSGPQPWRVSSPGYPPTSNQRSAPSFSATQRAQVPSASAPNPTYPTRYSPAPTSTSVAGPAVVSSGTHFVDLTDSQTGGAGRNMQPYNPPPQSGMNTNQFYRFSRPY